MKKRWMMVLFLMMFVLVACGKSENKEQIVVTENIFDMAKGTETESIVEKTQNTVTEIIYEGEYAAYDINEPMLFIQKKEDGTYAIQVGIFRLLQLDECIGVDNGNGLEFFTKEWGEDQEITGQIILNGDVATVTFYAPWSDTWFKDINEYQYYRVLKEQSLTTEENTAKSIQDEIAMVEKRSLEHCDIDSSNMGQQEMNYHSVQWYKIWDDELNSLWSRLSDELDEETKAKVLEEQRAWIKRKEECRKAAGQQALGGSLQPLLESETAAEMTRARVYVLAGYLAEVRNESFVISPEIQASLDAADPSLEEVFERFEGQWIFDEARGACVGIQRTKECDYGVEGSNWTVWVTGGDLFSDLDVYGYTRNNIIFKVSHPDHDAFYEISTNMVGSINLAYGTSLDAMDEVIVCE